MTTTLKFLPLLVILFVTQVSSLVGPPNLDKEIDLDGAINYITTQYEVHCKNPDGIVQQYKWHYINLWLKSVTQVPNAQFNINDLTYWERFMSTACPFPSESQDPKDIILTLWDERSNLLELEDFEQVVPVPSEVSELWPHFEMVKGLNTNAELVGKLVKSFNEYKLYKKSWVYDSDRKTHDDNLWIGYQKKLIVQLTILRVMREDYEKAKEYLRIEKAKFQAWRNQPRIQQTDKIPQAIVNEVARALYNYIDPTNPVKADILQIALMILYEKTSIADVKFEAPSNLGTFEGRAVTIPEVIKMFYSDDHYISGKVLYSKVVDKMIKDYFSRLKNDVKVMREPFKNQIWALLVVTFVPDMMSPEFSLNRKVAPPKDLIDNTNNTATGNGQEKWCDNAVVKWAKQHPYRCGGIFVFLTMLGLVAAYFGLGFGNSTTSKALSDITTSPETPTDETGAWLVWLIVAVMIIGAILLVGVVLYLICGAKRKRNHGQRDKASKAKTKKEIKKISSTVFSSNASSSKRSSSSSCSSSGASYAHSRSPVKTSRSDLIIKAKQIKVAARQVCRKVTQTSPVNSSSIVVPIASSFKPSPVSPGGSSISVLYASRNKSSKVESKVEPENSTLFTSVVVPTSTCPVSPPKKVKGSPTRTPKSPSGKAQSPTRKDVQKKKKNPINKK